MLDLDRFKAVNDTYGPQAGDAVLRRVAAALEAAVPADARLARFGGEEFVVVVHLRPGPRLADARRRPPRRRHERVTAPGERVTISAGSPPRSRRRPRGAPRGDRRAAYAAKRAGRDRVLAGTLDVGEASRTATSAVVPKVRRLPAR